MSSESETDDLVFLSPDESVGEDEAGKTKDQGASPTLLRRSNRKRKSVTVLGSMSKNSATKKKKNSPDPGKSMPRIPRTPQGNKSPEGKGEDGKGEGGEQAKKPGELEALLLAMEERLAAKIDRTNEVAKQALEVAKETREAMEDLDLKVETTEVGLREEIREAEERIMESVEAKVKGMVDKQLLAAGFDQDLSAGDLTMRSSVQQSRSYAGVASSSGRTEESSTRVEGSLNRTDKQEAEFWRARRSLRMWPVEAVDRAGVVEFLQKKLRMDKEFIEEEMGEITVKKVRDPKAKAKNEVIVVFETKQLRDSVRAKAANLANFGQNAGMRLELPNHLQKSFRVLMNLAYDLKQKNKDLRRNIKFDEDEMDLFMDCQLDREGEWKRVTPDQAVELTKNRRRRGPARFLTDELRSLVGTDEEETD